MVLVVALSFFILALRVHQKESAPTNEKTHASTDVVVALTGGGDSEGSRKSENEAVAAENDFPEAPHNWCSIENKACVICWGISAALVVAIAAVVTGICICGLRSDINNLKSANEKADRLSKKFNTGSGSGLGIRRYKIECGGPPKK
jgi:hypothetical protein